MRATIRIGSVVLLVASMAIAFLAYRQYRYGGNNVRKAYTRAVNNNDIVESARKAFTSLSDAELRAENYVLTGETIYSEAFREDQRTWEDESGTLEAIARKGHLLSLSEDFSKSGKRTMDELVAVVALYEKSGRDPAIDRIRKSSSIVYLDQSQKALTEMVRELGGGTTGSNIVQVRGIAAITRLTQLAAALFAIAFITAILSILGWRPPSKSND